ncbi:TPA: bifunctional tetrahydrofolate synthase/dihydrofolate synthase [Vibrio parahaemolyticus]|uniref:bifunctional tetrahydrofolate synthase/dihydrofolate synthase n=1 Tax=Vibrio parahaemolyticus TaxID=670 RepID=UPI001121C930|nr:bifunctional tetrahydrofolate synthase/dihydrofolate synthase [Vibrio parahaemolyticus]EGQ7685693.1 bifunctional tetrahydrofolate synthase/dihydrofolate synthase [Vibrio parahaemolyticus]EGQ8185064.1 bifunctional tetrahydrofolate synthase/dihydrofolate synthase [Vibrio parahaemolyticus]EGQ8544734.1 bifunctional tetrahydrofolate synthase/dihydrofolate synthase [Vibrio parahaemolyticus]EGQ9820116.1 bifunctional tetrahydrofolate synthase/dihydrofolate synthase [Vibrio parahaemolyticus]EJC10743
MTQNPIPQATSPLAMWLDYLSNIHSSAIDLGLDRVQAVATKANLTKPAPTVITVAGTNGKGSTCALMEAILLDAGYSVGVYSSPHLIRYNERVRIKGVDVEDAKHCEAFDYVEKQRGDISLSLFEFGTLAALRIFQVENVDVVLLEVGLGGRLDATNVVEHDVSVITSLAIDHVDWLGDDINVIGFEKAGIYRAGKPAICGQPLPPATVAAHADDIGAEFFQVGIQFDYALTEKGWKWSSGAFALEDLPLPSLPLPNAATALMALGASELQITDINIVNGLNNARLAGRMQVLQHEPEIVLDVAHNPHSAEYLVEKVKTQYAGKTIHVVIAMLHDKDIKATLAALKPIATHWYPASLTGPRAATADELCQYLPQGQVQFQTPIEAFESALSSAASDDVVLVAGSFHTVGEVLEHWQSKNK